MPSVHLASWFVVPGLRYLVLFFVLFYLLLSVLGLCCYVQVFSSCDKQEWGLLFVGMHGLLIVVASLVAECGLQ